MLLRGILILFLVEDCQLLCLIICHYHPERAEQKQDTVGRATFFFFAAIIF